MNEIAGRNGYGRLDMIENRLVGVKSRECYEVPGGLAIIEAHKALEDLCLERDVLHYKLGIEQAWAVQVYDGLWFSPLKQALDAFLASTQQCLTGTVRLRFYKGTCTVVGRKSDFSLYSHGPGHLRRGRHLRPRRRQGLHRPAQPVAQDVVGQPPRAGRGAGSRWDAGVTAA